MSKELKIRVTYSHFNTQHNLSIIAIERLTLDVNNIVDNQLDRMIDSDSPSTQAAVFVIVMLLCRLNLLLGRMKIMLLQRNITFNWMYY